MGKKKSVAEKKPWFKRRWVWAIAAFIFLIVIIPGSDDDESPTPAAVTTPAAESTPTPEPSPAAPSSPTPEPSPTPQESKFDAAAARDALLEDIYAANGLRTIEESCTTEYLIEGTWFQCYFDDVEFVNKSTLKVTLSTLGDVDADAIGESTRRWFVNMVDPSSSDVYPDLSSVYTSVNGLDSASQGRW